MKNIVKLKEDILKKVNGGDEETYNIGYKVGEFFGKIGAFVDRCVEIFT